MEWQLLTRSRAVTVLGLLVGALGIAILWLFVLVGFLISPTGLPNLFGEEGTGVATGQGVQLVGVLTALVAGVIATRANYHK